MKKGISLIVLVITILVLAILAGAIIVSVSNTNTINKASDAVEKADLANANNIVVSLWAESAVQSEDGKATLAKTDYESALTTAGLTGYTVTMGEEGACPKVTKSGN